jgi:hypothetical protein
VDKIEYFEIPELPGKPMFRCEKRKALLQVSACSKMWGQSHEKNAHERYMACRGCTIGAKHAGVAEATLSPFYRMSICGRCHSGAIRLINGHLCVSCQNRQYEWIKGRNARGKRPITHPDLHRLSVRYATGGRVKTLERANVVSTEELIVAALRDEPKQVTFAPQMMRSPLPQLELFV